MPARGRWRRLAGHGRSLWKQGPSRAKSATPTGYCPGARLQGVSVLDSRSLTGGQTQDHGAIGSWWNLQRRSGSPPRRFRPSLSGGVSAGARIELRFTDFPTQEGDVGPYLSGLRRPGGKTTGCQSQGIRGRAAGAAWAGKTGGSGGEGGTRGAAERLGRADHHRRPEDAGGGHGG